jgi:hypothetical protein
MKKEGKEKMAQFPKDLRFEALIIVIKEDTVHPLALQRGCVEAVSACAGKDVYTLFVVLKGVFEILNSGRFDSYECLVGLTHAIIKVEQAYQSPDFLIIQPMIDLVCPWIKAQTEIINRQQKAA